MDSGHKSEDAGDFGLMAGKALQWVVDTLAWCMAGFWRSIMGREGMLVRGWMATDCCNQLFVALLLLQEKVVHGEMVWNGRDSVPGGRP